MLAILPNSALFRAFALAVPFLSVAGCADTEPAKHPPGHDESLVTDALEVGAAALQTHAPVAKLDVYLAGFHPMKAQPSHQMEAHHFCRQVNEDFAQCVLFDGNSADANLNGIEYIISERLFNTLAADERQYWHPHNYEILSGQLVAPGIPAFAQQALMRSKINSYGKTWHVWDTRKNAGTQLPLGEPMLAWSFNRDGEAEPAMVKARNQRMGINAEQKRQQRAEFVDLAKPQFGVDALRGEFPRATEAIPGV